MKFQYFLFVFIYCVYYVLGETTFFPKGQRAEIFELTDNEVPIFRITLSNDEYNLLKLKASFLKSDFIEKVNSFIKEIVEELNKQNFTEIFPGYNFNEILPELPINEYGHPNIDYEKYYINYNNFDYMDFSNIEKTFQIIFKKNSYLDLINVFYILHDLDKSPEVDKSFIDLINLFVDDDIEILGDFDENKGDNYNTPSSNWDYDSSTGIKELDDDDSTFTLKEKFNKFVFGSSKNGTDNNFQNHTNDRTKPINNDDNKKFEKFTSKDFYEYFKNYKFYKTEGNNISFNDDENKFKTKNATLIVEINNKKKVFDKITFSLGGSLSRTFAKPGYNLKIRGGKELFGRRQFKLRSDFTDPTYMRTKLVSDIRNRIGIPSLSANYVTLCINDEYLGLFILTDLYKQSWIEYVYGEKNTELLYKCNQCYLNFETRSGFKNENKEASNVKELYEFLAEMTKAKSASDIESIFDLDLFYKNIAVDFLVSSWDHIFHNYCIYKNKINNKWIYLSYDFDLDMGRNVEPTIGLDIFSESPILEKLISNDNSYFKEAIIEIVSKVFNPAVLFPHIDEIKSFIRPFVELDKTPDEKGQYPGRLNKFGSGLYSFEQWEDSIEFKEANEGIYSLKKFILLRYRIICHDYDLECDPIYLDNNYENSFTITSNLSIDEDDYNDIMDALDDDEEFLCDPIYIAKHYEELFNTTDISFDESNKKIEKTVNDFENNEDFTKHEDF